jgi:hypothetical protein
MNIHDFRRIALSLEGAEESSHMGSADFRVGGRIFATLAAAKQGYGNIMITPEQQTSFVEDLPEVFIPVKGGWGRNGATHVRLDPRQRRLTYRRTPHCMEASLRKKRQGRQKRPSAFQTSAREEPLTRKTLAPFNVTLLLQTKRCIQHARTCKQCPESSPSLHTPRCNIFPTSPYKNKPDVRTFYYQPY